uniref:Uncharacterized protein n=1 Tax=Nelumbo nucifera TaxID=4432 RepID=A0A822Y4N6_NELNU|nr:TPA_asm: hypothetical protein HUJ06_027664 [Nelumbo nucifera]
MIGSTNDLLDVCGDFFDQIDDLLDFSTEDIEAGAGENYITSWTTVPPDTMIGAPDSVFSGYSDRSSSELATELSVPVSSTL